MDASKNRKAFLDMIAYSEGTYNLGDNGYNVIVGGSLFNDYSDHPRKLITVNKQGLKSTAAGRYQLLSRYYDAYKKLLNLDDFSPESQDAIAIQQIKERKALPDIDNGKISIAIGKCSNIWASFPGAGYGQRENKLDKLLAAYKNAGGEIA
jgi:muramidase (phage lysozyme)